MKRSKSGEKDVFSGEEPNPKRHKGYPDTASGKNVMVLLDSDVRKNGQEVFMPNTIEMAELKRFEKGQYIGKIKFTSEMTETDVHWVLLQNFPILTNKRRYSKCV